MGLFKQHVAERTIEEIRTATNKAWGLGNNRFQDEIEKSSHRQAKPKPRGGDRRSGNNSEKSSIGSDPFVL